MSRQPAPGQTHTRPFGADPGQRRISRAAEERHPQIHRRSDRRLPHARRFSPGFEQPMKGTTSRPPRWQRPAISFLPPWGRRCERSRPILGNHFYALLRNGSIIVRRDQRRSSRGHWSQPTSPLWQSPIGFRGTEQGGCELPRTPWQHRPVASAGKEESRPRAVAGCVSQQI